MIQPHSSILFDFDLFLRGGPVEDVEDSVAKRNNIIFHRGHGAPGEEADLVLMHTDDAWHIENCDPL
jgi:hypothetical protein